MTYKILCAALLAGMVVFAGSVSAAETEKNDAVVQTDTANIIHVGVNGMVCDFCAQSLKIVFMEEEAVKDVDISLEKKQVTLHLKDGADFDDKTITHLITASGYEVAHIKRP